MKDDSLQMRHCSHEGPGALELWYRSQIKLPTVGTIDDFSQLAGTSFKEGKYRELGRKLGV